MEQVLEFVFQSQAELLVAHTSVLNRFHDFRSFIRLRLYRFSHTR
jgi:hypothetical protein